MTLPIATGAPSGATPGTEALARWAREWASRLPCRPQVVLTLGDGAHLPVLEETGAFVVSFAPGAAPQERRGGLLLTSCPDRFESLARRLLAFGLEVFRARPPAALLAAATRAGAEDEALWERRIAAARRSALLEAGTRAALAEAWQENLQKNLPRLLSGPWITGLANACAGMPVLVAGAGPSLARWLEEGAAQRDKVLLLAASSALRPLHAAGLRPDAAVVIEGRDCRRHFERLPSDWLGRIVLFAESNTHPRHLELPWRAIRFFHGPSGAWLAPLTGDGTVLPTGGNVGTTALVIGWLLGGSPVLAAGLDFAAPGGRYYAPGSGSVRPANAPEGEVAALGWHGERVTATPELDSYRRATEETLAAIRARQPGADFVAVAGTARVAGMTFTRWEDWAAGRPPIDAAARAAALAGAGAPRRRAAVPDLPRALEDRLSRFEADPAGPLVALAVAEPPETTLSLLVAAALARRPGPYAPDVQRAALREAVERIGRAARRAVALAGWLDRPA